MYEQYEILLQFWEAISFVNEELHSNNNNIIISSFHFCHVRVNTVIIINDEEFVWKKWGFSAYQQIHV